ncbi:hypothetical protein [Puniceicoccus vermicola]|uniref:DUF2170 family protein n=1 Tax=Puniceicoccus vermicola TaxID=388746 RepID=A0A7X1B0I5_9BACT|nr:hypothetical protein [Puniceicoccus vermicola]MBC2603376.1 hypothetical protein [Puniceicoccus vermicola]
MNGPIIHTTRTDGLIDFLQLQGMEVEALESPIYRVVRDGELPVYLNIGEEVLTFEVDLGGVCEIACEELYRALLDANTEIQPVSFGLDSSNPEDPRLVLEESRVIGDLSDREILSVFDALELAADKAEQILAPFLK